ncbi:hypothetical protein [Ochrobactrum sp. MYb379]
MLEPAVRGAILATPFVLALTAIVFSLSETPKITGTIDRIFTSSISSGPN